MGVTLLLCGCIAGVGFTVGFAAAWSMIAAFFTTSQEVVSLLDYRVMLLVCALQPFNGMVFVLDGLLIGARDTRYLMWAMLIGAALLIAVAWSALELGWGLIGIVSAVGTLMAWRSATNLSRFLGRRWANG
jgi:MATE family multidrug resistance protein